MYATLAALQVLGLAIAVAGLYVRIPVLHRIAAPASALLVLNTAAVVGFYKFLFTRGPLWKIWNSSKPPATGSTSESEHLTSMEPAAAAAQASAGMQLTIHDPERSSR